MSGYSKWLLETAEAIEGVYGLNSIIEDGSNRKLFDLDIKELILVINDKVKTLHKNDLDEMNVNAFSYVGFIYHLHGRLEFFDRNMLDFSRYPERESIKDVLKQFLVKKTLRVEAKSEANFIVGVLDRIDKKYLELRFELAYRYLRLFVIMVMYSNYVEVSLLVRFLLSQIERS